MRKRIRQEAEDKIKLINDEIDDLNNKAMKQKAIVKKCINEENNPYYIALDSHLNSITCLIEICTSYLPDEYCIKCFNFFPRRIKCECDCDILFSKYNLYGPISLYYHGMITKQVFPEKNFIREPKSVILHCENDILAVNYILDFFGPKIEHIYGSQGVIRSSTADHGGLPVDSGLTINSSTGYCDKILLGSIDEKINLIKDDDNYYLWFGGGSLFLGKVDKYK